MLLTSAFSRENSDISLEELNMLTTATRKVRIKSFTTDIRSLRSNVPATC